MALTFATARGCASGASTVAEAPDHVLATGASSAGPGPSKRAAQPDDTSVRASATIPAASLDAAIPYDDLRRCYIAAREQDRTLHGRMEVRVKIGADGSVESAEIASLAGAFSSTIVSCVLEALRASHFNVREAGNDTLILPIEFEPSH